jgi:hypothetical protein
MEKYILGSIALLAIAAMAAWNVNLHSQSNELSAISLANMKALALGEALPYESMGCKTERCDADPSPNGVTSSVKRACLVLNNGQYSSCTEVPCGDVFYGCN